MLLLFCHRCVPSIHPKLRLSRSVEDNGNDTAVSNVLVTEKPSFFQIDELFTSIKSWWTTATRSKRALSAQNQQVMKAKQTSNKDQVGKNPGANRGGSRGRESGDPSLKDYDIDDANSTAVVDGEKGPHKGAKGKGKHGKRKGTISTTDLLI